MPNYDYVCENCGLEWEQSVKIADRNDPPNPPECEWQDVDQCIPKIQVRLPGLHSGYGINGRRTDQNFKDILRTQKKFYDKADKARSLLGLPGKKNSINVDV
jgi:putative FmdB family regulatory protein